ncbi:peroxiredoxin [Rudaeicoccus suwonensis]|uniref:Alkyl hydroperoxide reductase E n=1 Tax=Rudaeicoccus suwonensis TaxID=657409 RepID=A0A561E9Y2_9MICO|nr:peroxiredoxin [Rudaeicoccus suwonensis]TWE12419.1 peroxiredoxin [Rudaeicoccus suwonensis]
MSPTATDTPRVGDHAPDFTLKTQYGEDLSLSAVTATQPALLVFYPFAWSGICTGELCAIRDDLSGFEGGKAKVLAISCDPMFTLRAWSDDQGFAFSLLSDFWPHGQVASSYGVFNSDAGLAIRGTFLVGTDGLVAWEQVNGPGEARDFAGYREALAAL